MKKKQKAVSALSFGLCFVHRRIDGNLPLQDSIYPVTTKRSHGFSQGLWQSRKKASAKQELKDNIKKAQRDLMDPERSTTI